MKLTKMCYIASPYTAHEKDKKIKSLLEKYRFNRVSRTIGLLQDIYPYAFIGPITQSHITVKYMTNKNTTFKNWARRDLTYISRCDEVWVLDLPGWQESKGVSAEIKFAYKNDIPVKFINHKTLKVKAAEFK